MSRRFSTTELSYLKGLIRMAGGEWLAHPARSLTVQTLPKGKQVQALLIKMPQHEVVALTAPLHSELAAVERLCDFVESRAFDKLGIKSI